MQMDESVLNELVQVAQFALNDVRTIRRVASELSMPETRVEVLAGLAIELSTSEGEAPSIQNLLELSSEVEKINTLKAEFDQ